MLHILLACIAGRSPSRSVPWLLAQVHSNSRAAAAAPTAPIAARAASAAVARTATSSPQGPRLTAVGKAGAVHSPRKQQQHQQQVQQQQQRHTSDQQLQRHTPDQQQGGGQWQEQWEPASQAALNQCRTLQQPEQQQQQQQRQHIQPKVIDGIQYDIAALGSADITSPAAAVSKTKQQLSSMASEAAVAALLNERQQLLEAIQQHKEQDKQLKKRFVKAHQLLLARATEVQEEMQESRAAAAQAKK